LFAPYRFVFMSRSTIRLIIILASVLFIGLVSTQIIWVKKAYAITHEQMTHEIELALINVVQDIQTHSGDSTFLVDPVNMISPHFYRVQINEELEPFYLESMLKTELQNRELNYEFRYSIYNCFNDSVVFSKHVLLGDSGLAQSESEPPPVNWENDGHYFSVFFPSLNYEVIGQMKFWVISSIVLIAVLIFFAYVINIILRQKKLSEIKTDFINNMTHELKTPISTIALSSDVLLSNSIQEQPERFRKYAAIIKSENQRLQNQVERVLQVARLEKNELSLEKSTIDIHELIEVAAPTIAMSFEEQTPEIDLNLNAANSEIVADETHITNVIFNLLDNALKYGGNPAKVTISSVNSNNGIELSFTDNGKGIPKEHLSDIFEKFYRIPTGNIHNVKGFGLGLHYVKSLVESHGGKVTVKSKQGKGSTFCIWLPYGMEIAK